MEVAVAVGKLIGDGMTGCWLTGVSIPSTEQKA